MITAETMAERFRNDGWHKSVSFTELNLQEAEKMGCLSIAERIRKGKKYFRMAVSGNVYDENGKIALYNISPRIVDMNAKSLQMH